MFDNITIDKDDLLDIAIQAGIFLLIIIFTIALAKIVKKIMSRKKEIFLIDNIQYKFLSHFIYGLIYFFGLLYAIYSIPGFKGLTTSFLAGSGILAIILGFASQQAFSNIIGGIFIAIFKPFRTGDQIKFAEKNIIGIVEDITLRHTVIRTFDNKRIIVPNSNISSETLENSDIVDKRILKFFELNISYDSNIDLAMQIIKEEAVKHPKFLDNRSDESKEKNDEPVVVRLLSFNDSSLTLRANVWAKDPSDAFIMGCDLNKSVKERFDIEGIEIPYPYYNIINKEPKIITIERKSERKSIAPYNHRKIIRTGRARNAVKN